ncbi:MAG TPA: RES family NAD+ phosphorylase [Gammaproteobacteria bacterium]|nr:RES family NAD+ phosphorylase [Gammaproteobacteria bacterium]
MEIEGLAITADAQGDWHRNIVTLRRSQDLFDDLTDDTDVLAGLRELEMAFKPFLEPQPAISRPFEEADVVTPIMDVIEYPFLHPCRSRFSEGRYGVWYGADTLETSIRETVHHWRKDELAIDLSRRTERIIVIHRRVHLVECIAALVDLRPHVAEHPALLSDSYDFCQRLGMTLQAGRQPGLITESARNRGASIVAVFQRQALTNVRDYCYLTYRLDLDTGRVEVEREPGNVLLTL